MSSDTKFKLKIGLPLSQFTGITAEMEKEWKISKEIEPERVISFLRRVTQGEELQITKFNELEETTDE